jgi:hypothetical protein
VFCSTFSWRQMSANIKQCYKLRPQRRAVVSAGVQRGHVMTVCRYGLCHYSQGSRADRLKFLATELVNKLLDASFQQREVPCKVLNGRSLNPFDEESSVLNWLFHRTFGPRFTLWLQKHGLLSYSRDIIHIHQPMKASSVGDVVQDPNIIHYLVSHFACT